jgi:hypothetical protein
MDSNAVSAFPWGAGASVDREVAAAGMVDAYPPWQRATLFGAAAVTGVLIAGFWNVNLVDGFGRDVATQALGGFEGRAAQFGALGAGFGFVFAVVAGLAATFTACNCVAFAMIPGLACAADARHQRRAALRSFGVMLFWVALVGAVYGAFVGRLGPVGAAAFNSREIRGAQAFAVFTVLGLAMLVWAAIEMGFLDRLISRCTPVTRAFFRQATTKAALMGILVGAFAIGRPYPVFREFLLYTAQANRPDYAAATMAVQGVGQVIVMAVVFLLLVWLWQERLERWVRTRPHQPALLSALALAVGGAYFVYYWGVVRLWPELGRWGLRLGLYE